MIKIKEAIIVEGKYDKAKLSTLLDAVIIETRGFRIFKDKDTLKLIQRLAGECGIIVLTDSDAAGFQIRAKLQSAVPPERIKHAYIPDIFGKERRKTVASKEGKLGVEGMNAGVLLEALQNAGVNAQAEGDELTKADFFMLGLSGKADSAARRKELLKKLDLPERMPANSLIKVINSIYGKEKFLKMLEDEYGAN